MAGSTLAAFLGGAAFERRPWQEMGSRGAEPRRSRPPQR